MNFMAACFSSLSLRLLQPLAQALDVFIVRLVLLLVHFQQRPQDFRCDAFSPSHAQHVQTRLQQYGIRAVSMGLQVFIFVCG